MSPAGPRVQDPITMKTNIRASLTLVAGFAVSGCAVNPATGNNQLMLVSEAQEIEMGRQADAAVVQSIGLYADPVWQSYIQQFGARLAATSERPSLPWTFRVVDDPAVNAFAVPGGFVYVTLGPPTLFAGAAVLATVGALVSWWALREVGRADVRGAV